MEKKYNVYIINFLTDKIVARKCKWVKESLAEKIWEKISFAYWYWYWPMILPQDSKICKELEAIILKNKK